MGFNSGFKGLKPRPGRFHTGKIQYPLQRKLGVLLGQSVRMRKISPHWSSAR